MVIFFFSFVRCVASDPSKSAVLNSLPTLPFKALRNLFKSTPPTTESGVNLRMLALEYGAVHIVLACLAIFTHQPENRYLSDFRTRYMVRHFSSLLVSFILSAASGILSPPSVV